jgi:hypothetical protein
MKIIAIKPSNKFGGAWCAEEASEVAPCFTGPSGKQQAIDYARNCRFGGSSGEIHIYDDTGEMIFEIISVHGVRALGAYPSGTMVEERGR